MAATINDRDNSLDTPRVLFTGTIGIRVTADSILFSFSAAGVATPSTINFSTTQNGISGTVNWSVVSGTATLSSSTGNTNTLLAANMATRTCVVRASVTISGITYQDDITITKTLDGSNGTNGTNGTNGSNGASARIAYVKVANGFVPSPSSNNVVSGDNLPTANYWGTQISSWTYGTQTVSTGESLFQTTGTYDAVTNQTTWVVPYLSNLKVGTLSALTVYTGALEVDASGCVRGGQTAYNTGTGFWIGYSGGTYKLSIGSSSQSLTWDGTALTLKGNLQVNNAALSGTTMTGTGAQFNASGTFALGTSANNITYDGTDLVVNGELKLTSAVSFRSSATKYVTFGGSGIGIASYDTDAGSKSVFGSASGTGSYGVYGLGIGSSTFGVYGESNAGTGVFGYTLSGKALRGSASSTGYAVYAEGRVGLISTTSPLELNSSQGNIGQTLISQGAGATPAWGNRVTGGAVVTDASGNATISIVMGSSNFGFSGTTTSGAIVTVTSVTNTGGNNYDVVIQTQLSTTGMATGSRGVRWVAVG
jgi:hypothetical protein